LAAGRLGKCHNNKKKGKDQQSKTVIISFVFGIAKSQYIASGTFSCNCLEARVWVMKIARRQEERGLWELRIQQMSQLQHDDDMMMIMN
jgi:hypothetical protein